MFKKLTLIKIRTYKYEIINNYKTWPYISKKKKVDQKWQIKINNVWHVNKNWLVIFLNNCHRRIKSHSFCLSLTETVLDHI